MHGTDLQLIVGESSYETDLEEVSIRKLIRWRPDGIILVGTNHSAASRPNHFVVRHPGRRDLGQLERPIQALVGFDNAAAAQDLAERLIDKDTAASASSAAR